MSESAEARYPTRVKICGLRRSADAIAATRAGADYVGLVLAESIRRVTVEEATEIVQEMWAACPDAPARPVGVFVDAAAEIVSQAAAGIGLAVVQLHGVETPEQCRTLRADGFRVWKALRPRTPGQLARLTDRYAGVVDGILVEGYSELAAGGTGTGIPHEWLCGPFSSRAQRGRPRLILAGGLTPANVADAIRAVGPDVVDVSSGVERSPGEKDAELIRAFVAQAGRA
jgi:phosphoribosylanthranilate isomerase